MANVCISIIVPVYNAAPYLRECLDSIVQQTLEDIEILCINDGSTDASADILEEYAGRDARITVVHQKNAGYGHAMNTGIGVAAGTYVGIVEPDDYVHTDMYRRMYHIAKRLDLDMVKADFYRFTGDGAKRKKEYIPLTRHTAYYGKVLSPQKHPEVFTFRMNTWTGIYKRRFLIQNKIRHQETPGAAYQDNGFWFQTFCLAKRVYFLNEPFYRYRMDNPESSVQSRGKVFSICREYDFIYDFLERNPELKERFIHIFSMKRYHNYQFTLMRIGTSHREEFLARFSRDFRKAEAKGELSRRYFSGMDWFLLHRIMESPAEYGGTFLRERNLCYRIGYYLDNYGIQKTMAKTAQTLCQYLTGAGRYGKSIRDHTGL